MYSYKSTHILYIYLFKKQEKYSWHEFNLDYMYSTGNTECIQKKNLCFLFIYFNSSVYICFQKEAAYFDRNTNEKCANNIEYICIYISHS